MFLSCRKFVIASLAVCSVFFCLRALPSQERASLLSAGADAVGPSDNESRVLAQWFRRYDGIVASSRISYPERKQLSQLLFAASVAPLSRTKYQQLDDLLNSIMTRFIRGSHELAKLPDLPETKQLKHDYALYLLAATALCVDATISLDKLSVRDAGGEYSVLNSLLERKKCLEGIFAQCGKLRDRAYGTYGIAICKGGTRPGSSTDCKSIEL